MGANIDWTGVVSAFWSTLQTWVDQLATAIRSFFILS